MSDKFEMNHSFLLLLRMDMINLVCMDSITKNILIFIDILWIDQKMYLSLISWVLLLHIPYKQLIIQSLPRKIKRNTAFDVIFQFYAVFMISTMRFVIILNDELDYPVNSTI